MFQMKSLTSSKSHQVREKCTYLHRLLWTPNAIITNLLVYRTSTANSSEIAYLEGATARRLSEIKERERALEKLRTEYESGVAEIEELKEAQRRMET